MTRTIAEARQAALIQLASPVRTNAQIVLIDAATKESDVGWIFFDQSAEYMETGDVQHALVGNAPLFVPRDGSPPQFMSYHRAHAESLDAYRYCGKIDALPNAEVELLSGIEGAQAARAMRALRDSSTLSLAAVKRRLMPVWPVKRSGCRQKALRSQGSW